MNTKSPAKETGAFFIKAVLDVGTNSVKLLAAKFENTGANLSMETLADTVIISRLGDGSAETGVLSRKAMERTVAAMSELCAEARRLGANDITTVGTEALRRASNADEFINMAEDACGVRLRVISGEEEAELSFAAAVNDNPDGNILVFDVGGGSSEVVSGHGGVLVCRRSVPVGALSLYKKFFVSPDGVVSDDVLYEAGRYINKALAEAGVPRDFDFGNVSSCVGIGGTITTLAAVSAGQSGKGQHPGGVTLDKSEICRQIIMYASTDLETRKKVPGLPTERADIILPGACIVRSLMSMSGQDRIIVCRCGLRHGIMLRDMTYQ
jgi:exopolyphosphatase/guanosine-5'-triphosphate,3'-diphosphate pyrophosphatase